MNENLTPQDWMDISAFLDGRLHPSDAEKLRNRIQSDTQFQTAYHELGYARRLLRAMPSKKAPHNFTLSSEFIRKPSRKWGVSSFFGLASAASALVLVFLFIRVNLFTSTMNSMSAMLDAPSAKQAVPEAAIETGLAADMLTTEETMIITWNDPNLAYGKGGGGGDEADAMMLEAVPAIGEERGLDETNTFQSNETMATTELDSREIGEVDPSTLILGIPAPGTEGLVIETSESEELLTSSRLPASTWWMITLGAASLAAAVLAFYFRRR